MKTPAAGLRRTLLEALEAAGGIVRAGFGKARVRYKGRADIVTQVDEASEQRILDIILRRHPSHDFLAEERAPRRGGSEFCWVIDPLDGTLNYAHGYPCCCVSIAALHEGRPLVAGVLDPFRRELFLATRGEGTALDGRRMRVSRVPKLSEALLVTGFPYDRAERASLYAGLVKRFLERCHDLRRSGSAALDMAWIAAGRADGFWEFSLSPWDVAAGLLLVEEAGGRVTDFSGRAWTSPEAFGRQTLATNDRIHRGMLSVIRRR